jgi:hypothetical protein
MTEYEDVLSFFQAKLSKTFSVTQPQHCYLSSNDTFLTSHDPLFLHYSEHKYNCTSNSLLDKLLQVWWCWLVSKTPIWIAPNLLTIVGLFVNILTSLWLIWYSPDAKSEAPRWCYLSCAVGLFIYQSLDAIGELLKVEETLNVLKRNV